MKRFALLLFALAAACRPEKVAVDPAHAKDVDAWRTRRVERLKAEDGWLTLIGLHWLTPGDNPLLIHQKNVGVVTLQGGKVMLTPTAPMTIDNKPVAGQVQLADDTADKGPTIVQMGTVRFQIIKRGDRFGVRVKDANAETRTHFKGIEMYPLNPEWRVEARLDPYDPPKKIPITDITGMTSEQEVPGALVFNIEGKEYRLDPLAEGDEYFVIFRDETSKNETYPAGRYLYAKKADANGVTTLDFNKSYNPPCAFTPYATCPLPPLQNRLATRVEAGEKKYAGGHA
jgi:uncharacterized protein (DUF1684 family)